MRIAGRRVRIFQVQPLTFPATLRRDVHSSLAQCARRQTRHLLPVGPRFAETDHVKQILPAEPGAVVGAQLSRQRRDNFFSVLGARLAENVAPDPAADSPIEQNEFGINS